MGKHQLSSEDKRILDHFKQDFGRYLETIKRAQQFKLDDFLILKIGLYGNAPKTQVNTYGAPVKYRVVHVNEYDVPFVKRINKNGDPLGRMSSCVGLKSDEYYHDSANFSFELDPDFADSILLQDSYDPTSLHRSKKDIWKAVTKHNKECKVKTDNLNDLVAFFSTVNVGDTLWTSNISSYLVQDKKAMSPADFNKTINWRHATGIKGPMVIVLTVRDKNGKVKDITPDFFHWKALYKERPRSYKELNI